MFWPGSLQQKDAILYASRPGLRLWKAAADGTVQATYIFRELIIEPNRGFHFLHDSIPSLAKNQRENQFGGLLVYESQYLVSFCGAGLYLVDPGTGSAVGYHTNLGHIVDVAVCGDEVFVLRKAPGRILIRLAQKPEAYKIPEGNFKIINYIHVHK